MGVIVAQEFALMDKINDRLDRQLFHDPPAMHFHGFFGNAKFKGNLLVKAALPNKMQHLALARRKLCNAFLGSIPSRTFSQLGNMTADGQSDCREQHGFIYRLQQKVDRALFHGEDTGRHIALCRQKNDWESHPGISYMCLQRDPVRVRKFAIKQHAARLGEVNLVQEFGSRSE